MLTQEEVAGLLESASCAKHKAVLSVAYGAGLRASEVVSLKVSDIDSARMVLRVHYKDYRAHGLAQRKVMTLATNEFIRRFMLHILPKGFHRMRHYGLFANTSRAANLAQLRELLGSAPPPEQKVASSSQNEPAQTVLPPCPDRTQPRPDPRLSCASSGPINSGSGAKLSRPSPSSGSCNKIDLFRSTDTPVNQSAV